MKEEKQREIEKVRQEIENKLKQESKQEIERAKEAIRQNIKDEKQVEIEKISEEAKEEVEKAKEQLNEDNLKKIEEITTIKDKSIQDLKIKIDKNTTEFEALKKANEDNTAVLNAQIADLIRMNDRNSILIQEKDTQIELLKRQLDSQHNIIEQLNTSTEPTLDQVVGQNTGNPFVYNTNSSKLVEIIPQGDKLKVNFREKLIERRDFLYWINNLQVCLSSKSDKWILALYSGITKVDSVEIKKEHENKDKFHRIGNKIYVGMTNSYGLYCVTVGSRSLSLVKVGNTGSRMYRTAEYNNCVYVACYNSSVIKIANKETTTVGELTNCVLDLEIKGNTLIAVDYNGIGVKIDLNTETEVERVKVESKGGSFLAGEAIGTSNENKLLILNKKGEKIVEHDHKSGNLLPVLAKILNYTVLTYNKYLYILNNTTFELETHKIAQIAQRYSNLYYG